MKHKPRERKRLSGGAISHVIGELRKLESRGRTLQQGSRTFILCPFHNERSPSCLVTTSIDSKYEIGSFRCMGCEERGDWNKLAEALGLEPVGEDSNVAKTVLKYESSYFDNILKERWLSYKGLLQDLEVTNPRPVPADMVWRTIPSKILNKVKACLVDGRREALLLPAYMHGELVGGIRALLHDPGTKEVVKYKNSSGEWSRGKGLYPFDFASQMMDDFEKKYGFRALALVEGARDSLCLNCEEIPTLGLLGTQSWCDRKMDSILDLDPDFCLVVMDGDSAGRTAEELIWKDMRRLVPTRKMNLTRFNKDVSRERGKEVSVDPGNAPSWVLDEVWRQLHKRKSQ